MNKCSHISPPYTITSKILDLTSKISENIAKLKKMDVIERVGGTRGHWEVK